MVKTTLIESAQPAEFDAVLLRTVDLTSATPESVWSESMLIGIRNEYGDVYRAIGVTGLANFVHVLEKLHGLGCACEVPDSDETKQGFDAHVTPP
jgi:hypothetical protein